MARLSREDLEEVYSLRRALEQLAVRQAVRFAESQHFERMKAVLVEMAYAVDRGITG